MKHLNIDRCTNRYIHADRQQKYTQTHRRTHTDIHTDRYIHRQSERHRPRYTEELFHTLGGLIYFGSKLGGTTLDFEVSE